MSGITSAKAISRVVNGGIRELTHARVFEVDGSKGGDAYRVVVTARETTCNCQAGQHGRLCYHVMAAKLLMAKQQRDGVTR